MKTCKHNLSIYSCRDCGLSCHYCVHDKDKKFCKECDGRAYCPEHGKLKKICKDCGAKSICKHNKHKSYCKECNGSACCRSPWCSTIPSNRQYEGYCLICYIHLFPEKPILRNYKTKEKAVADFVKASFPDQTWIHDKKVADGCSKRRPDLLCDLGDQVVVVEVDEDQHEGYDCTCENKRLMEISQDIGHRPLVFIRFNPDDYIGHDGTEHPACWEPNALGLCSIADRTIWDHRLDTLRQTIQSWLSQRTEKTLEVVQLYFNGFHSDS